MQKGKWVLIALVFCVTGCVSGPREMLPPSKDGGQDELPSFQQGLAEIRMGNHLQARVKLNALLMTNPSDQLRVKVEAYLKLIDELEAYKARAETSQKEAESLRKELTTLRQEAKKDLERCQKEAEELRRNLDYLKAIDIELQRRNRSVR